MQRDKKREKKEVQISTFWWKPFSDNSKPQKKHKEQAESEKVNYKYYSNCRALPK